MNEVYFQQGDVLLKKVSEVKGKKLDHLILATGEKTGHKHQIVEGDAELYENDGTLFLRVLSEKALLGHEEHQPQIIEKGNYEVCAVREYSHFDEEARKVED